MRQVFLSRSISLGLQASKNYEARLTTQACSACTDRRRQAGRPLCRGRYSRRRLQPRDLDLVGKYRRSDDREAECAHSRRSYGVMAKRGGQVARRRQHLGKALPDSAISSAWSSHVCPAGGVDPRDPELWGKPAFTATPSATFTQRAKE